MDPFGLWKAIWGCLESLEGLFNVIEAGLCRVLYSVPQDPVFIILVLELHLSGKGFVFLGF